MSCCPKMCGWNKMLLNLREITIGNYTTNFENCIVETLKSNMADGDEKCEKQTNLRSLRKHTRERFYHFLELVEKNSLQKTENSASEENDDEINEEKVTAQNKKPRLQSDAKDNNKLSNRNEKISKGKNTKQKKLSRDETADINKYVDCNSDINSVECEETYWLEDEVVFIPADQRMPRLEYVVK